MQRRDAIKRHPPLVWDDARLFLGILRAGSLAGGARALGLDKSTLSRRVARMERALGSKLFVRSADGLRPSSVAERLRTHAETIEAEVRSLISAGIAASDEVRGPVRVATTEGMAPRLVRSGLLDLRTTHPALELEILGGNRAVDLGAGEADLALRVTPTKDARLVVRVLGRWSLALFASPRYLHARGTPRSPSDLSGHDLLLPSGELARMPEAMHLAKARGARITLRSSSLPALVEAAILGYGLVPMTRPWGESVDGLALALALDALPLRPAWLVATSEALTRPAVRLVADRIIEAFRGLS